MVEVDAKYLAGLLACKFEPINNRLPQQAIGKVCNREYFLHDKSLVLVIICQKPEIDSLDWILASNSTIISNAVATQWHCIAILVLSHGVKHLQPIQKDLEIIVWKIDIYYLGKNRF